MNNETPPPDEQPKKRSIKDVYRVTARPWLKNWKVNLANKQAIHTTGLIIQFTIDEEGHFKKSAVNMSAWVHGDPIRRVAGFLPLLQQATKVFKDAYLNRNFPLL